MDESKNVAEAVDLNFDEEVEAKVTEAVTAVRRLQAEGLPDAVIAGGFMRDLLMNREFKDVDIFVRARGGSDVTEKADKAFMTPGSWVITEVAAGYEQDALADVVSIRNYISSHLVNDYQLIELNMEEVTPKEVVDRIDIGLCRVATDGFRPFISEEFLRDRWDRALTLYRCEGPGQFLRSYERAERLRVKRYKGFTFRVPEQFREHAEAYWFTYNQPSSSDERPWVYVA